MGEYGEGVFTVGEEQYPLSPGSLFFARPGVRHRIQNRRSPMSTTNLSLTNSSSLQTPLMELSWVSFGWTLRQDANGETASLCRRLARSEIVVVDGNETPVVSLWKVLKELAETGTRAGTKEQIEGVSRALLLAILQAGAEPSFDTEAEIDSNTRPHALPTSVRLAIRFLQDNLERHLSVEETAQQVGISSRHLARLFTEHLGVSPTEFLERTRLDRASGLLRRTDLPIKEIAFRTGYSSVHYFTRRFHQFYGASPGAYRASDTMSPVRILQKEGALV